MHNIVREYIKKSFLILNEKEQEELYNIAIKSLKNETNKLKKLLNTDKKEDILNNSHKIKGILLNMGFAEIAKEFETTDLDNLELAQIKERLTNSLKKFKELVE